jgi:ABC-type proline/glycine betaine transport system substrate-binding protein
MHIFNLLRLECRPFSLSDPTSSSSSAPTKANPRHIHVVRDNALAKFWPDEVSLAKSRNFPDHELSAIEKLVAQHRDTFRKAWDDYFGA